MALNIDSSFNSLPRRSSNNNLHNQNHHNVHMMTGGGGNGNGSNYHGGTFQRNTPVRRSTGIMADHLDYYVPRSISEFNLSGVGDLALPPPKRTIFPQHLIASAAPQLQQITTNTTANLMAQSSIVPKPREKMVTFEDESAKCPHGMPATPRKGPIVGDVFM